VELKGALETAFSEAVEIPVGKDGCFAETGVNPKQAVLNILDKIPKFVTFGESQVGDAENKSGKSLDSYRDEQIAKGRNISFSEAAEEFYKQE
jgi:hypothetical protein